MDAAELRATLDLLEARAQFDAPERPVHVRVAAEGEQIYVDLADDDWQTVEIGPGYWRIIANAPVRFWRRPGMLPLSRPQPGGTVEDLASLLNLQSRNDLVLVVSWLLAAFRGSGPYPVLAISGEQGSAKTTLSKLIRALVDPNTAPVRALSREERELMISANNAHVLAFDNLSAVPHRLSDALCRLATGGSFAVRQLYTDDEEVLFEAARPILLNGIEDIISRADLADRAIFLNLGPIPEEKRRSETEVWREFEAKRPLILGLLFDAVARGLQELPHVRLDRLPRMADFTLWATACETALWPAHTFIRAYEANRQDAIQHAVEAEPIATFVRKIMAERSTWRGTAAELLGEGAEFAMAGWPANARVLSGRLRRAQTCLRALGIEITFARAGHDGSRVICIKGSAKAHAHVPDAQPRPALADARTVCDSAFAFVPSGFEADAADANTECMFDSARPSNDETDRSAVRSGATGLRQSLAVPSHSTEETAIHANRFLGVVGPVKRQK
ncbi:MAG: hypothetical protein ACJ8F3_01685 [Xanthobacteraceae bacterium]